MMTFSISAQPSLSANGSSINQPNTNANASQPTVLLGKATLNKDTFEKTTVKSDTGASINYRSGNSEMAILKRLAITSEDVIEGKLNHLTQNLKRYTEHLDSGSFSIVLNELEQTAKEYADGGTKIIYKVKLTPNGEDYALALIEDYYMLKKVLFEELPALQAWRDTGVASHNYSHIVPIKVGDIDAIGVLMPLMDSTKHFDFKNADHMNNRIPEIENIQNVDDLEAFMETLVQQTISLKLKGINIMETVGTDGINLKQHQSGKGLEYMIYDTRNPPNIDEAYKNEPFTEKEIAELIRRIDYCSGKSVDPTEYIQKFEYSTETVNSVAADLTLLTQKANEKLEAQRKLQNL